MTHRDVCELAKDLVSCDDKIILLYCRELFIGKSVKRFKSSLNRILLFVRYSHSSGAKKNL